MSNNKEIFFADEEAAAGKLGRKARESPFMVVGKLKFSFCGKNSWKKERMTKLKVKIRKIQYENHAESYLLVKHRQWYSKNLKMT